MKDIIFLLLICTITSCRSQTENSVSNLGGPCEGCEAVFEYGDRELNPVDTLPGFSQNEPKLKLTGTIFQSDGRTPAEGVILYIYHTNRDGIYQVNNNEQGWGQRHGSIRGWIKTDGSGKYTFFTFRPGAYPNGREPEHIHFTVKEPGKKEYYLDDILFENDPLLTQDHKTSQPQRGGSGIITPTASGDLFIVERNIILGKNIPNYE